MDSIVTVTLNPALDVSAGAARVEPTTKLRCSEPRFDPGGGGINVARVAARLGADATAVFPAGGSTGDLLKLLLEREGVPSDVMPIAAWTRQSIVIDESSTGLQFRFLFPGPELSLEEQRRLLERLLMAAEEAGYLVLSGSIPPAMTEDFFRELRSGCVRSRTRLVVDGSGAGLRMSVGEGVYLMKPNREELAEIIGRPLRNDEDVLDAARELVSRGWAEAVVASLGAQGALLVRAGLEERVPAIPIRPRSAVGAGDSMLAAIIVGLSRGMTMNRAVRFGVAAGAAALLTEGTELARKEDVERLSRLGVR